MQLQLHTLLDTCHGRFPFAGKAELGTDCFVTIRDLGTGSSGDVRLVRWKGTNQLFAMKIVPFETNEDTICHRQRTRIERERSVLNSIRHPFITEMLCSFEENNCAYFILEYCSGGDLDQVIRSLPEGLTEEEVRYYAVELVLALEYLHQMGFVHRDLKPENILLHENGHIRLADFGVSEKGCLKKRIIDAAIIDTNDERTTALQTKSKKILFLVKSKLKTFGSRSRTRNQQGADKMNSRVLLSSKSIVGTMEHMSPEVILREDQSTNVDWWGLGSCLFTLLYGRTPFDHGEWREIPFNILGGRVEFPAHPLVSESMKDLVRSLLQRRSVDRLGHHRGAGEIKNHAVFEGVQWALIREIVPPILPQPKNISDSLNDAMASSEPQFIRRPFHLGKAFTGLFEHNRVWKVSVK